MKRILFVDDQPMLLEGLKRMLFVYRNEWDMAFATSAAEALQQLATAHFDVVVTDVRMPQMTGIELLSAIRDQYPQIIRIILSGQSSEEVTLSSVTLAHQFLAKPCDANTLRATVQRALDLRIELKNPVLQEVVSKIHSLPSLPTVYTKLIQAVQSPDVSAKEIGEIIGQDLGMSAKVLQLVNSAFFGVRRHITSPTEAVVYIGTETVRALALTLSVFSKFDPRSVPSFSLEHVCNHSLAVGSLARKIAKSLQLTKSEIEDAFLGGLLHAIGRLVLACNFPEQYEKAIQYSQRNQVSIGEAEREIFGATHGQVGAYLLWLWGLPDNAAEIVAWYDRPNANLRHVPILVVHTAHALTSKGADQNLDMNYVKIMGFDQHVSEWRQLRDEVLDGVAA